MNKENGNMQKIKYSIKPKLQNIVVERYNEIEALKMQFDSEKNSVSLQVPLIYIP